MPIALLLPIFTSLGKSLAEKIIGDGEYLKWIKVIFDVIDSGSDLENRFKALAEKLETRLESGGHFEEADFDAIVKEITGRDQAWKDL